MTLSTLASIASVLSSVAICASLIYLAVQVQQSDRNQGTLLRHLCANDGDHLEVRRASQHRDRRPRLKRRVRLHDHAADAARNLMRATLFGLQDQFLLEQRALVSPTQVTTNERGVMRMFSAPAFRALWTLSRELYAPEFALHVDRLLNDVAIAPPSDLAAQVRVAVAELEAAATIAI